MLDIASLGSANVFSWTKEYFLKVVTEGREPVVTDPVIANALKQIDRADFLPDEFKKDAYADKDMEIAYGEKMLRPTVIAQMLSLLKPKLGGKYLDIGTGVGYFAVLLGFIAGEEGEVFSIERVQWFWELARSNYQKYEKVRNVTFLYRDGMEGLKKKAPFDGIRVGFAMDEVGEDLKMQLKVGGRMIVPTNDYYIRVIERVSENEYEEEMVPGFVVDAGKVGTA